jgi:hypothetical protein
MGEGGIRWCGGDYALTCPQSVTISRTWHPMSGDRVRKSPANPSDFLDGKCFTTSGAVLQSAVQPCEVAPWMRVATREFIRAAGLLEVIEPAFPVLRP